MKFHVGFLFCIVAFFCRQVLADDPAYSAKYMNDEKIELHLHAQEMLFNECFGQVDSIYARLIDENPTDPAGYLFRAASLIVEMLDREEDHNGKWALWNLFFLQLISISDRKEDARVQALASESTARDGSYGPCLGGPIGTFKPSP